MRSVAKIIRRMPLRNLMFSQYIAGEYIPGEMGRFACDLPYFRTTKSQQTGLFHRLVQHSIKLIHRAKTVSIYRATG